jgi:hypothetical protein
MKARMGLVVVSLLAAAGCMGNLDATRGEGTSGGSPAPPGAYPPPAAPTPIPSPTPPAAPPMVAPPPATMPPAQPPQPPSVDPPPAPGCAVSLLPENPPHALSQLLAAPDSRLRVRAQVSGPTAPATPTWKWDVLFDNTTRVAAVLAGSPDVIEFPVLAPGVYRIRAEASPGCYADQTAFAELPEKRVLSYWVRVTPPRGWDLPPQDNITIFVGGSNAPAKTISLDRGVPVRIDPHDANNVAINSFIRVSSPRSAVRFEGHNKDTNTGFSPFLLPQFAYEVLLVPDGPVAPALIYGRPQELVASMFKLDPGIAVSGDIRAGAGVGAPVSGARVLLRSGGLPSTIGITGGAGAFELRARPGTWSGVILPPPDSTLPEAQVQGISLDASAASLRFQWRPPANARLDVTVTEPNGQPTARGIRLRIQAEPGSLPDVGTALVGAQALRASGFLRVDRSTGPGGIATFAVPAGRYQAIAVPPVGSTDLAITTALIEAGTGQPQRITLVRPVVIAGSVLPAGLSSGLQVVAIDAEGSSAGESVSATIDEAGQFSLAVAPGRSYRLQIEPAQERKLPRFFLGGVTATADMRLPDLRIAEGVVFVGTLTFESSLVPGAVVQVFCTGFAPDCVDPDAPQTDAARPVAETISDAAGRFQVHLPDPRSWHL